MERIMPPATPGLRFGFRQGLLYNCLASSPGSPFSLLTIINRVYKVYPRGPELERYRIRLQKLKGEVNRKLKEIGDTRQIRSAGRKLLSLRVWPSPASPPAPKLSPAKRCAAFLRALLDEGVNRSADLRRRCGEEGFSYRAFVEARQQLHLVPSYHWEGGKRCWRLSFSSIHVTETEQ
jgi:hypothetical protein